MEEVEDPVSPHITESWIMLISEQHRYQGVSYKSDITLISGQHILTITASKLRFCCLQDWTRGTDRLWRGNIADMSLPVFWTALTAGEL